MLHEPDFEMHCIAVCPQHTKKRSALDQKRSHAYVIPQRKRTFRLHYLSFCCCRFSVQWMKSHSSSRWGLNTWREHSVKAWDVNRACEMIYIISKFTVNALGIEKSSPVMIYCLWKSAMRCCRLQNVRAESTLIIAGKVRPLQLLTCIALEKNAMNMYTVKLHHFSM